MSAIRRRIGMIALGFMVGVGASAVAAPIRALVLSGSDQTERREALTEIRRVLDQSGRFEVRLCESPIGLGSRAFEGFDLVVDDGGSADETTARSLAGFVAAGKGLVVTYGGVTRPSASLGLSPLTAEPAPTPATPIDLEVLRGDHPIVAGLALKRPMLGPVATARTSGSDVETIAAAGGVPVAATRSIGSGRVVALTLGKDAAAWREPDAAVILARAGEWAATGGVRSPDGSPRAFRALLVTGGHFHDASFYGLFDGVEGLKSLPVETSSVFQKDVRDRFDVVIFYDFTRDLDETSRKNLRDFVEAGKGVVVLHHGLLDFQTWTWWSEKVVGGRYRLQREGTAPSSSVKDDVPMFVVPAGEHPVLRGVAPFLLRDEAYKNLYHAENAIPLLKTDAPESDPVVAWVGPCASARVVAVQLGHGTSAYEHPSYRRLIHNAVRWSARAID
ncbi:ThuA domain-containing protein [Paludisphaera rhizosphaerae]|uniref:ThuA domain-containing protein n=1 Tax=Paludisphaera rhizosphaerae TaxID=2711216 RepID=UPI0013EE2E98|nr:ThuA domain-containing protein [Paludisphaera rhizosphaerae]